MQDKYCGDRYDIYRIQSRYTKVAAFGRHHKRGGAAFGRATSFVVSFVMALNRVNIVAVNAILVLHVGKTGRRTVGRTPLGLHVPSPLGLHVPRGLSFVDVPAGPNFVKQIVFVLF